ncbi:MAG: hypothetical protein ABW190_10190 [Rhizobacter sp.]
MSNRNTRRGREPGLFIKHLKGDYSLARSYWVHNVLLGWGMAALGAYALHGIGDAHAARHASMGLFVYLGLTVLVGIWSTTGAWMSALKHLFGRGQPLWAVAAMLTLALGALGTMREFVKSKPALIEHWAIAQGEQPAEDFEITMVDKGRVVWFRGGINEGASAALDKVIADAPRVTTVLLESPGGWMREGERMAAVIQRYRLSTRIEAECASACTVAFLAGIDRTAGPEGVLGFHRGRSPGDDPRRQASDDEAEIYRKAGVPPAFVKRILATAHEDIWEPSHGELRAAGVLTR